MQLSSDRLGLRTPKQAPKHGNSAARQETLQTPAVKEDGSSEVSRSKTLGEHPAECGRKPLK